MKLGGRRVIRNLHDAADVLDAFMPDPHPSELGEVAPGVYAKPLRQPNPFRKLAELGEQLEQAQTHARGKVAEVRKRVIEIKKERLKNARSARR